MSWINKILPAGINRAEHENRRSIVPEGVWTKCIKCDAMLYRPDLERNAQVCPKCDHHMRIGARRRLDIFLDTDGREELFAHIEPVDRLKFRDKKKYSARLAAAQKSTGERDALIAMRGTLYEMPIVTVAFEFAFHGGSMGQAVGEKFSQAAQLALAERIPLVCFAASGGARMQEALISLMQMAKTSAVIERMHGEGVPYISVLTDPIYGGVSASLALLGDLNIAEPDARAGFAGPNIIEQTIRQQLPKGFQRSEFLLEHGAIDMIVPRLEMRDTVARALAKLSNFGPIAALADNDEEGEEDGDVVAEELVSTEEATEDTVESSAEDSAQAPDDDETSPEDLHAEQADVEEGLAQEDPAGTEAEADDSADAAELEIAEESSASGVEDAVVDEGAEPAVVDADAEEVGEEGDKKPDG